MTIMLERGNQYGSIDTGFTNRMYTTITNHRSGSFGLFVYPITKGVADS